MSHDLSDNEVDRMSLSDPEAPENPEEDPNKENSGAENAEDAEGRRIDPSKKKIIRRTIPKLNLERLKGPKGVISIEKYFEGFKFQGKNKEKEDLDRVMKRLEHWAHRLFPKYEFDDFLEKTEALGSKKEIQTFLTKYRKDMLSDDMVMEEEVEDGEVQRTSPEPVDEFDMLIAEQIERTKQASSQLSRGNESPRVDKNRDEDEEIKKRMEMNRQAALERRLAKIREKEKEKIEESGTKENDKTTGVEESSQTIEETQTQSINITQTQENVIVEGAVDEEEEIKKRIEKNRQIALERKLARMKQKEVEESSQKIPESSNTPEDEHREEEIGNETVDDIINHYKGSENGGEVPEEEVHMEIDEDSTKNKEISADEDPFEVPNTSSSVVNEQNTSKKKLTDEELDKEIGAALNMFMKGSR